MAIATAKETLGLIYQSIYLYMLEIHAIWL